MQHAMFYIDNEETGNIWVYWNMGLRHGLNVLELAHAAEMGDEWVPPARRAETPKPKPTNYARVVWMTLAPVQPEPVTEGHAPVTTHVKKRGARPSADSAHLAKLLPGHLPPPSLEKIKKWKKALRVHSLWQATCRLPRSYRKGLVSDPKVRVFFLRASLPP